MKSEIRDIKEANIARRLIAAIMDAVVFGFVALALMLWVMVPIVNKTMNYENNQVKGMRYESFSMVYVLEEHIDNDTPIKIIEPSEFTKIGVESSIKVVPLYDYKTDDLEFYRNRLKYYYCNFKTNINIQYDESLTDESIKELYYSPLYNKEIELSSGEKVLPKDYYTEAWFDEHFGPEVIKDSKAMKQACYDAVKDLYNSSFFNEINREIKKAQIVITVPPYVLLFIGFYIVVPICYKNGETFGKKVMGIGFVTKDGYSIQKRQIVFRQILMFLWTTFCLVIVGIGFTSLATLGVGIIIYLVATLISKTKRSPMDYAAYTYLIQTSKSVWFKDEKEEAEKQQKVDEKMSKYRNVNYVDKHVIQVGTEIVDEQVKKEFEEEKSNNNKK